MRQAARADSEAVGAVGKGASGEARSRVDGNKDSDLCVSLFSEGQRDL